MDQTSFNEDQAVIQPPPEPEKPEVVVEEIKPKKPKKGLIILVVMLVALGVLLVLGMLVQQVVVNEMNSNQDNQLPQVVIPANPTPTPSEFGQKLIEIETQINQADPSIIDLDPPPLNYQIRL